MEDIEKYSKRVVQVMPHQNEDIDKLLQLMGVPLVKAPSEAEAECAALCKLNKAFAVASEDMDSLSFGAPRLVRYLLSPVSQKLPIMEYDLSKVLEELKLSLNQFVDLCILAGCDYIENIKGIGPQTALKLVQKYGSIEVILENLNKDRYHIPDSWAFPDARELFHQPLTSAPSQPEFEWNEPNEEGIKLFLVEKNNFNQDRVMKGLRRLEIARKESKQVRLKPSAISCGNSVVETAAKPIYLVMNLLEFSVTC
ncbi:hypothetical protein O6H91_10G009400 [Diphasiastrum complanatum]|uniref:Uncharacterized protein n=3 Tax=Diphasiastrum complanatum TaxID=34168 RepID=A0ACC2CEJ8_DIPCM|nr:hypothetical protein O6H91_10G009400 [Diphasiastrum complanatum]KAJ7540339.1 hypothetical protein O6H91_10G009400 [Diphasiastrum complanatum]